MNNRWAQRVSIAIAILLLPTLGRADTPAPDKLVRQANEALTAGKVDDAMAIYKQLAQRQPGRAELVYNQAVALYRKGNYDQAAELLGQSLKTRDKTLEAKARFNLGNCAYADALQLAKKKDKKAAVKQLQTATSHYRESLQANPNDADARANIELAQMLIKQLQQKPKQNQQNKQQQKSEQKKQDRQDKQSQKQQNKQQQQEKKNQKNKQQKQDQQTKQQKQQQKQQGQPQQKKQNQPADSKAKPGGSAAKAKPVKMDKMSPEEAAKLLQAVRDRNLRRRIEKYHARQRTAVPVDKDW